MTSPLDSDPLQALSREQLRRLARRAARARASSRDGLVVLARRAGVEPRRLRLLADAWTAAGASGVDALGPAPGVVDLARMRHAVEALERWWQRHHPLEELRWTVWRNRLTVEHGTGARIDGTDVDRRPLLQLRLTADGRWHLYRRAAQGEWWPVPLTGGRSGREVGDCLDEIRVDVGGRFWPTLAPGGG